MDYHVHSEHPIPGDVLNILFIVKLTAKNQIFKLYQHLLQYLSIFLVFLMRLATQAH